MLANVTATAATLNAVRVAAGRRLAVRTSTPMIRDGKRGMASGRARWIATDFPFESIVVDCGWDADTGRWERKQ